MDSNKILIDWLTFTSKLHNEENIDDIIAFLGLNVPNVVWQTVPGLYGYKSRLLFGNISIMFDGFTDDMGVCVSMSGQGCRDFESYSDCDWMSLFKKIISFGDDMNITRLDVAYDDFDGLLDIDKICDDVSCHNFVSPLSKWEIRRSSEGSSAYIGSPASPFRLRFYDKAMERGFTDGRHWVRCEMQLRKKRAYAFVKLLVDNGDFSVYIGELYAAVLNNYLRFVIRGNDSNLSRCDTALWWLDFVKNLNKISLFTAPGVEYNEFNLSNYVFKQAGNSIYAYIESFGIDKFINGIRKRGTVPNIRQKMIIDKYNKLSDDEMINYVYEYINCHGLDDYSQEIIEFLGVNKK